MPPGPPPRASALFLLRLHHHPAKSTPLTLRVTRRNRTSILPPLFPHVSYSTAAPARQPSSTEEPPQTAPPPPQPPQPNPHLNPPTTTLPAPLDLPARDAAQSLTRHWLATGRAYYAFYKAGLGAVRTNWRTCRAPAFPLPLRLLPSQTPASAVAVLAARRGAAVAQRPPSPSPSPPTIAAENSGGVETQTPQLPTRSDLLLHARTRRDLLRLPLFAVLLVVLGEWLPLITPFLGAGAMPGPCALPAQVRGSRTKARARRQRARDVLRRSTVATGTQEAGTAGSDDGPGAWLHRLPRPERAALSAALAPSGRPHALALLGGVGVVRRRVMELAADGALIREAGVGAAVAASGKSVGEVEDGDAAVRGVAGLSVEEVRLACEDRGVDTVDRDGKEVGEGVLRGRLQEWVREARWGGEDVVRLVLGGKGEGVTR